MVQQEREQIMKQLAGRLHMPGFRKGKVPAAVVEKQYGPTLQKETLDRVIGEAYRTALAEHALQPISDGEVEKVDWKPEADLTFEISFDVRPHIELARLSGFKVERPRPHVADADVDRVIERLRDQSATWRPIDDGQTPMEGELVSVRMTRLDESGEPEGEAQSYQIVLGEGDAIPDVEAAILEVAPGQTRDFTVHFPMDFHNEERRGEEQRLRIAVVDRRTKELPALDEVFARSVGEFDTVDALRTRARTDLEKESRAHAEAVVAGRLLDAVLDANPFDVPRSMVTRYVDSVLGDTSKADPGAVERARAQLQDEAELAVKRLIVVERVADAHDLRATRDEVEERVAQLAQASGITTAQARGQLQKSGRLDALAREITERKVLDLLTSQSEIRDE
ncbi:MAG: trigger factor [Gemmatimonadetes bacterium]|nr:trigger factor [Gemmatimonadota bacterium]